MMRIGIILIIVGMLGACYLTGDSNQKQHGSYSIYRSTDGSFQKDFYLKIGTETATIFGWLEVENTVFFDLLNDEDSANMRQVKACDTVYYKSECDLEIEDNGRISFSLEDFSFSTQSVNQHNLGFFEPDNGLCYLPVFFLHSSFFSEKEAEDSLVFLAVKHLYSGRADKFVFRKLK
ncbi:MAG: hypothetical protein AB8F95_08120 [Bacteroidia bacterium]